MWLLLNSYNRCVSRIIQALISVDPWQGSWMKESPCISCLLPSNHWCSLPPLASVQPGIWKQPLQIKPREGKFDSKKNITKIFKNVKCEKLAWGTRRLPSGISQLCVIFWKQNSNLLVFCEKNSSSKLQAFWEKITGIFWKMWAFCENCGQPARLEHSSSPCFCAAVQAQAGRR